MPAQPGAECRMWSMDEDVQRYVAGIAAEYRELFDRVNKLISGLTQTR